MALRTMALVTHILRTGVSGSDASFFSIRCVFRGAVRVSPLTRTSEDRLHYICGSPWGEQRVNEA